MPNGLRQRILREFERWRLVGRQIHDLEAQRTSRSATIRRPRATRCGCCSSSRGSARTAAWLLVREFFGWRGIRNRRELASLAGLTPTPYDSGESRREQGISKAGNRRVRWMMIELAWGWLRYQPESELSRWYQRRFGEGNTRLRKVGIVAVARKLLVALWKYLETGEVPAGAEVFEKKKFRARGRRDGGSRRESDRSGESECLERGELELAWAVNHERTGLEGATENGSGLSREGAVGQMGSPSRSWLRVVGRRMQ